MEGIIDDYDDDFTYADVGEKTIRRRSSKACDQCRKHKTKCKIVGEDGRCENCTLLGFACTFLGPTRKRGPPKGYLDAIEARFNQLEALLGAIVMSKDPRARSLLDDLRQDTLARELIARVDDSQFGTRGRTEASSEGTSQNTASTKGKRGTPEKVVFTTPDDPNVQTARDWQDRLDRLIRASEQKHTTLPNPLETSEASSSGGTAILKSDPDDRDSALAQRPISGSPIPWQYTQSMSGVPSSSSPQLQGQLGQPNPSFPLAETRRFSQQASNFASSSRNVSFSSLDGRLGGADSSQWRSTSPTDARRRRLDSHSQPSQFSEVQSGHWDRRPSGQYMQPPPFDMTGSSRRTETAPNVPYDGSINFSSASSPSSTGNHSHVSSQPPDSHLFRDADDVTDAIGQLSIDENESLRYHGRASGLHLLARAGAQSDGRHQGGLWRFPPGDVWPQLDDGREAGASPASGRNDPVADKQSPRFSDGSSAGYERESSTETTYDPSSGMPPKEEQERLLGFYFAYVHPVLPVVHRADFMRSFRAMHREISPSDVDMENPDPIAPILLFAMFALAARYVGIDKTSIAPGKMTRAGLAYYEKAREILARERIPSRQSTCQAMLLMTYRDIGVGSMVQAWHAVGIAIRTAQDIGLHRSLDKWQSAGASRFSTQQKKTFRRIWYACVVMDQYVSTYIGRPLSTFSQDFDTPFPEEDEDDGEDEELWQPPPGVPPPKNYKPVSNRIVSCFRASATLSSLLEAIVSLLYSIRPTTNNRCGDYKTLVGKLDKWLLDLPVHLRYDTSAKHQAVPPPHILSLHMAYWCTVMLINRPFIDLKPGVSQSAACASAPTQSVQQSWAICENAASRITDIVQAYSEAFTLDRCPAFFSYYIFTASIMHLTVLVNNPKDVHAGQRLQRCMDALQDMRVMWPSAGRQWDILQGSRGKTQGQHEQFVRRPEATIAQLKRPAEDDPVREHRESFPPTMMTLPMSEDVKPPRLPQSDGDFSGFNTHPHHAYPTTGIPDHPLSSSYVAFPNSGSASTVPTPGQQWNGPPDVSYVGGMGDRSTSQFRHQQLPRLQTPYFAPGPPSSNAGMQLEQPSPLPVMQFWDNSMSWDGFGDSSALSAYLNNIPALAYTPHPHPQSNTKRFDEYDRQRSQTSKGPVYTYELAPGLRR